MPPKKKKKHKKKRVVGVPRVNVVQDNVMSTKSSKGQSSIVARLGENRYTRSYFLLYILFFLQIKFNKRVVFELPGFPQIKIQ